MNHLKVFLLVAAIVSVVPLVGCSEKAGTTVIEQPDLSPQERAAADELEASY